MNPLKGTRDKNKGRAQTRPQVPTTARRRRRRSADVIYFAGRDVLDLAPLHIKQRLPRSFTLKSRRHTAHSSTPKLTPQLPRRIHPPIRPRPPHPPLSPTLAIQVHRLHLSLVLVPAPAIRVGRAAIGKVGRKEMGQGSQVAQVCARDERVGALACGIG